MSIKKSSFIIHAFVAFSTLFLFPSIAAKLLVPDKVHAYTLQDCQNITYKCNTLCASWASGGGGGDGCLSCSQEVVTVCGNMNIPQQPQVQQPVREQVQQPVQQPQQKEQPTAPIESLPRTVTKGQYSELPLSDELVALLGSDSSGGPYSFSLDTLGGFPPMGLTLGPDGVLRGTPTGKDSEFRACVKDVGGNTACKVINIDVKKEGEPEFTVPGNFRLTELAYNNLTNGKPFQSSTYERVVIKMPDDSLIHMDRNSSVTPVSDYEVKTDVGRYRFDYKPANGGSCGPIGQSPTWACRQVDTRDATLRVKGTEFLVDSDKYGTNITVMKGVLSVSDTKGKKTVDVAGGQYTYIKKGGLPTDPKSFDSSQVERWWEEKSTDQIRREKTIKYVAISLAALLVILFIKRKQIWPKRFGKPARTFTSAIKGNDKKTLNSNFYELLAVTGFLIGCAAVFFPINLYVDFFPVPFLIYDFAASTAFFAVKMVGVILGIIAFKSSKKSFAVFIIVLNIVGIVLGLLSGF